MPGIYILNFKLTRVIIHKVCYQVFPRLARNYLVTHDEKWH